MLPCSTTDLKGLNCGSRSRAEWFRVQESMGSSLTLTKNTNKNLQYFIFGCVFAHFGGSQPTCGTTVHIFAKNENTVGWAERTMFLKHARERRKNKSRPHRHGETNTERLLTLPAELRLSAINVEVSNGTAQACAVHCESRSVMQRQLACYSSSIFFLTMDKVCSVRIWCLFALS